MKSKIVYKSFWFTLMALILLMSPAALDRIPGWQGAVAFARANQATLVLAYAPTASTFSVTNGNASGPGSLRQAVIDANNNPGADTIVIDPSVTTILPLVGPTTAGQFGPIVILESVQIIGPGSTQLTIDDQQAFIVGSVINPPGQVRCSFSDNAVAKLSGIVFQVGATSGDQSSITASFQGFKVTHTSGFVYTNGGANAVLRDIALVDNRADDNSCVDGLLTSSGALTLIDTIITRNLTRSSDEIFSLGPLRIENSYIDLVGNSPNLSLLEQRNTTTTVVNSVLLSNSGALFTNSTVNIVNSLLKTQGCPIIKTENTNLTLLNATLVSDPDASPSCVEGPIPGTQFNGNGGNLTMTGGTLDIVNTLLYTGAPTTNPQVVLQGATITRSQNNFVTNPTDAAKLGSGTLSGDAGVFPLCSDTESIGDPRESCDPQPGSPATPAWPRAAATSQTDRASKAQRWISARLSSSPPSHRRLRRRTHPNQMWARSSS